MKYHVKLSILRSLLFTYNIEIRMTRGGKNLFFQKT